jgi:hypothetical protein
VIVCESGMVRGEVVHSAACEKGFHLEVKLRILFVLSIS